MRFFHRHVSTELSAYLLNELSSIEMTSITAHLQNCSRCRKELDEIKTGIALAKQLKRHNCPDSIWPALAARLVEAANVNANTQQDSYQLISSWRWAVLAMATVMLLIFIKPSIYQLSNSTQDQTGLAVAANVETAGSLVSYNSRGKMLGFCPLKHTDVKAEISGFISRVNVTQEFHNPFNEKIEAVYTFPLPENAAVDSMTMTIGQHVITGKIRKRAEAQQIYQNARLNGQIAGLLDQQRDNIFTQSVANIMPGAQIKVTISYVATLKYQDGAYEFVFPMVVGQRYLPAEMINTDNGTSRSKKENAPSLANINPPQSPKGIRAGHDISLEITLDAGMPIEKMQSILHSINVEKINQQNAIIKLARNTTIPNRDFILKYDVAGAQIADALVTHKKPDKDGFFSLILQPPAKFNVEDLTPKELVFVLDTSGSMNGFPIEKSKEVMRLALANLNPQDTFNLITFAGETNILFAAPVPATKENLILAHSFLEGHHGNGGTEMMKAIKAALAPSNQQNHLRIVCFMTDGAVGNDLEIIAEVKKHANARVFAFGIGNSVNRFLLDKIAKLGRGEVEYVTLKDDGSAAARRFFERVRNPLLTDITIDWNGLPVSEIYPTKINDLFNAKPIVISGRYKGDINGTIHLRGKIAGNDYQRDIAITLPSSDQHNESIAKLWARARIDELMSLDYQGAQYGRMNKDAATQVANLALEYGLMSQFTSFVAVDEQSFTTNDQPQRMDVPVETPSGTSHSIDGRNQRIKTKPNPTPAEQQQKGVLPYLNPMPRYEISQPGNILRQFERGGITRGFPSDVGSPDPDEEPGQSDQKLSDRGFGTALRTDPTFQHSEEQQRLTALPSVKLIGPLNNQQFSAKVSTKIELIWQPMVGVDYYIVEITIDPDFNNDSFIVKTEQVTTTKLQWQSNQVGRVYWRVKAVYKDGRESRWSERVTFQVK